MSMTSTENNVEVIDSFRDEYRWLSNFYKVPVTYENVVYPSVENAYQAAKFKAVKREVFTTCSPYHAKVYGRGRGCRRDWERVKLGIMELLLSKKFSFGSELANKLLATGEAELIEGNKHGDVFWGVCGGEGENHLGKLLMARREYLRNFQDHLVVQKEETDIVF